MALFTGGGRDGFTKGFRQAATVHHASEGIAIAEKAQVLVAAVAVINAADGAEDFCRPAMLSNKPFAAVFKPDAAAAGSAIGPEQIFDLEGDAVTFIDGMAAHDRVIAAGDIVAIKEIGIGAAGACGVRLAAQYGLHVGTPLDGIGLGHPTVGGLANGLDGTLNALQDIGIADRVEMGDGRLSGRRLRSGELFSPEGKGRLGLVFDAQVASKSLEIHSPT